MPRSSLAALLVVAVATTASAGGAECPGVEALTDATACAEAELLEADEELNRVYVEVMNRLQDTGRLEQKSVLRQAERAWIDFRDRECEFRSSGTKGGTGYDLAMALCLRDLMRHRTAELRAYLTCKEGDLSCPTW